MGTIESPRVGRVRVSGMFSKLGSAPAAPKPRKARKAVTLPDVRPDLSRALSASIKDVAAYAGMSRSAIWKAIGQERLKAPRIGHTVYVRIDSLHDLMGGPPAWDGRSEAGRR